MIKSKQIKTDEDKIHMHRGSSKKTHNGMVYRKVMPIASNKNVTQTILLMAIIHVSCGFFVKVSSGIMAFSDKGNNMKIDLNSDNL